MCGFGRMYRLWDTNIVAPLDPETDGLSFICLGDPRGSTRVLLTAGVVFIFWRWEYILASFLHDSNWIDFSASLEGLLCLTKLWESLLIPR